MNKVVAASRSFSVSAICAPSTFDTKCVRGPSWYGASASAAIAGPRSEPPMPILTMSVIFLPVAPRALPERTASANADMASSTGMNLGHDIVAVDGEALALGRPQRDMQHRAVLGDVDLVAGEHRVAPALDVGCLGQRRRAAPWFRPSPRISTSRAGSRRPTGDSLAKRAGSSANAARIDFGAAPDAGGRAVRPAACQKLVRSNLRSSSSSVELADHSRASSDFRCHRMTLVRKSRRRRRV